MPDASAATWLQWLAGGALDCCELVCVAALMAAGRPWRAVASAWVVVTTALRAVNLLHVFAFGGHLTASAWVWVDAALWRFYVHSGLALAAGAAAGATLFAYRAARLGARGRPWTGGHVAWGAGVVMLAAAAGDLHAQHGAATPVERLVTALRHLDAAGAELSPRARDDLAAIGIGPSARAPDASAGSARWAVWTVVESLDASAPRIAPQLARLGGADFSGVRASARPTHHALLAAACGVLPATFPHDTLPAAIDGRDCLPGRLRVAGWRVEAMVGSSLSFTGLGTSLRRQGFEDVVGSDSWPRSDTAAVRTDWGVSDRTLYRAALARLDRARAAGERLFLLVVTSDSHVASGAVGDCPAQSEVPASPWAVGVRCAADAVLDFAQELEERGLSREGALLVSGDHPPPDVPEVRCALGGAVVARFGEMFVRRLGLGAGAADPTVHAGTLDLGASWASWLGIPTDVGLGWPLGSRPRAHWLLGSGDAGAVAGWTTGFAHEASIGAVQAACDRGEPWPPGRPTAPSACDVLALFRRLDAGFRADDSSASSATVGVHPDLAIEPDEGE
ncbi:MAG: hypothetical protein H6747_08435 [Deltaproteobacteria bacterium]|nr:hypothetical protein [Deltaproteobacteria bacterium]